MQVRDVMTREVVVVRASATLADVATLMARHRISGLPVVERDELVGVITEGDIIRYLQEEVPIWQRAWVPEMLLYIPSEEPKLEDRLAEIRARPVSSAMTRRVVTVGPEDEIDRVAALLVKHRIKRVPVLERGKLVGIVSRLDLVRSLLPAGARLPLGGQASGRDA